MVSKWMYCIHQAINKVTVFVSPPHENNVHDIVKVFINKLIINDCFDPTAQG